MGVVLVAYMMTDLKALDGGHGGKEDLLECVIQLLLPVIWIYPGSHLCAVPACCN